jgi:hypothetical protein
MNIYLGDKITIKAGAFESYEAEVIDLMRNDDSMVMVRTSNLGRIVELPISVRDLELVANIEELRKERALQEQYRLEQLFHARNNQIRDLEEMILTLESGLQRMTQNELSQLLVNMRKHFAGISISDFPSESVDYLARRLHRRITEAQRQVGL